MILIINLLFSFFSLFSHQQNGICNQNNAVLNHGEKLKYNLYYNVIGLYVKAGTAEFTTTAEKYGNSDAFHFLATGRSNTKYDWIFKVRDVYESYVDVKTSMPFEFRREINEGKFHQKDIVKFDHKAKTAISNGNQVPIPDCTFDVISIFYAARNLNSSNLEINSKVNFNFFIDNQSYASYFRFLGKETITTQYGTFKVLKIAPTTVKGTLFKGDEKLIIWVTDDDNHVPVRLETPILVGSIKMDLVGYDKLKYPLQALQSVVD